MPLSTVQKPIGKVRYNIEGVLYYRLLNTHKRDSSLPDTDLTMLRHPAKENHPRPVLREIFG